MLTSHDIRTFGAAKITTAANGTYKPDIAGEWAAVVPVHDRFGDLTFKSVAKSRPEELTVLLTAEDLSRHRFIFKVEEEPPHKLKSVGMLQGLGHGHGH